MTDRRQSRMSLRARILILVNVVLIGFVAAFYGPHGGFLSLRNQLGVAAFNYGIEWPSRLMFEVLSARGYAPAAGNLGAMIFHGSGGSERDRGLAIQMLTRAAEEGFAPAQYNLSQAHLFGRGVPEDRSRALRWLESAASQDDLFALMELASEIDMFEEPQHIERVQNLLDRAAAQGEAEALYGLASHTHYTCKDGFETCNEREIGYLRQASEKGHIDAQLELGMALGRGVDDTEAFHWTLRAAESGSFLAMRNVADAYYQGDGVALDYARSADWAERAALDQPEERPFVQPRGYGAIYVYHFALTPRLAELSARREARQRMAIMYRDGIGVPRDLGMAAWFFGMGGSDGPGGAAYRLAEQYASGTVRDRDLDAARHWYGVAIEWGNEPAEQRLLELRESMRR